MDCFYGCLEGNGGDSCVGCFNSRWLGCSNDMGCQEDWNCLIACAEDLSCSSAIGCAPCEPEETAYFECVNGIRDCVAPAFDGCIVGDDPVDAGPPDAGTPTRDAGSDPDECTYDSQCGYHEACEYGRCEYVECTNSTHCADCYRCSDNVCRYCGRGPYGCYC